MTRKVIQTKDNSKTLLIESNNDTYHSIHGALTESEHVFIKHGFDQCTATEIKIFEMGFGTGLNCFLTLSKTLNTSTNISYHSIENDPITQHEINALDYAKLLPKQTSSYYKNIHDAAWNSPVKISPNFTLKKILSDIETHQEPDSVFDLIYFDAFGPKSQPHLWQPNILNKLFKWLKPGGTFITYCAQGQFKRDLKSVGFNIENLPGPPGKREITRGIKPLI